MTIESKVASSCDGDTRWKPPSLECHSTGIAGLDDILSGGWRVWDNFYPSVLVKGGAGGGKSLLALRTACEALRADKSVLYLSLDQMVSEIHQSMRAFRWSPSRKSTESFGKDQLLVLRRDASSAEFVIDHLPLSLNKAKDVLTTVADTPLAEPGAVTRYRSESLRNQFTLSRGPELDATVHERIKAHFGRRKFGMVVVDALSDYMLPASDPETNEAYQVQRMLFQGLCELGRQNQAIVVVVVENRNERDWRDFVADAVIELGWDPEMKSRYLEVKKARFTDLLPGRHELLILSREGVVVYPSARQILRRPHPTRPDGGPEPGEASSIDFCGNEGFSRMLGGHILDGSSTLIFGPDSTRKNVIATRYLQQGMRSEEGEPKSVMFCSCGLTESVSRTMLERYLEPEVDHDVQTVRRRIKVLSLHDYAHSDDELVDIVRKALRSESCQRVVVDDLAALRKSAALGLKELFGQHEVSSLFVHTVDRDQESDIREQFDTVIRTRHVILPNGFSQRIGYRVLKHNGATRGATRSWELEYDEATRRLTIRDAFQEYEEGPTGQLVEIPLRILAHCEYGSDLADFNRLIGAVFGKRVPDGTPAAGSTRTVDSALFVDTFTRDEAQWTFENLMIREPSYDLGETVVVSCDEYILDELIDSGRLLNLGEDFPETGVFDATALRQGRRGDRQLFAVPHYLNFGVYALRTDVVSNDLLQRMGVDPTQPHSWATWFEVAQKASAEYQRTVSGREMARSRGDEQKPFPRPRLFATPNTFDEDLVSCVLEVLWPYLDFERSHMFSAPNASGALIAWHQQLQRGEALPVGRDLGDEPAILERHWLASFYQTKRLQPDSISDALRIIPSPLLEPPGMECWQAKSMSGDWYLGVAAGSSSFERGLRAIRTLTSSQLCRRMYEKRFGFPARRELLFADDTRDLADHHRKVVSRRAIRGYTRIRQLLTQTFEKIFLVPYNSSQEIKNLLKDLDHRIDSIRASLSDH